MDGGLSEIPEDEISRQDSWLHRLKVTKMPSLLPRKKKMLIIVEFEE